MKLLRWLFTLPLAIVLVLFAVNNRHLVEVSLWPLDPVIRWPLFVYVYIGAVAGFAAGAAIAWVGAIAHQRRLRRRREAPQRGEGKRPSAAAEPAATGSGPTPPALTH